MKEFLAIILLSLLWLNTNYSIVLAKHANEKYCFDCMHKYKIGKGAKDYHKFETDLENSELSKKVKEQLKNKRKTFLVSYLLWENGKIKVDGKTSSKYGKYYPSHSVGKSIVSLVTGYAVCGGYVESVHSNIKYPTAADTLYESQKLINLLNMTSGDDAIVGQRYFKKDNRIEGKGINVNSTPIKTVLKKYFKGKNGLEAGVNYNYSAMTTNVIMNYVIYKTGDNWERLLHKVFVEDAKVENSVYFGKSLEKHKFGNIRKGEYGRYSFYAQRYDYLRIAKLIMDHWKNDTCVGKYLKTIYKNRIDKKFREYSKFKGNHAATQSYGGQFHFDPIGIKERPILMMDGFGGQQVVIDFNKNRIITVHSTDRHYDWYSLVYLQLEPDLSYKPVKN